MSLLLRTARRRTMVDGLFPSLLVSELSDLAEISGLQTWRLLNALRAVRVFEVMVGPGGNDSTVTTDPGNNERR